MITPTPTDTPTPTPTPTSTQGMRLYSWGFNSFGQLGDGTREDRHTPKLIENSEFIKISSGLNLHKLISYPTDPLFWDGDMFGSVSFNHTLGLKNNGDLYAWGSNYLGQLGNNTIIDSLIPIKIDENYVDICGGAGYSLGLKNNGDLYAWGTNGRGQLGDGLNLPDDTRQELTPIKVGEGFIAISAGDRHYLALKWNGDLYSHACKNLYGELGNGTWASSSYNLNNSLSLIKIGENYSKISCGKFFSLGLKEDGSLYSWGCNDFGQLGRGRVRLGFPRGGGGDGSADLNYHTPTQIGTGYTEISAGWRHCLALKGQDLYTWGDNNFGQLGNGAGDPFVTTSKTEFEDRCSPKMIDTGYFAICAGASHSLAIKTNGDLYAWGRNTFGQIGDGTVSNRFIPTKVGENYLYLGGRGSFSSYGLKII